MSSLHSLLPELSAFPSHLLNVKNHTAESPTPSIALTAENEMSAKIAAAHALGVVRGREDVNIELASKLAELEARRRLELEAARKAWAEEEGSQLADLVVSTLADIETNISQSLQQVMSPFLEKTIPRAAMAEFQHILEDALQEDFKDPIFLSGPEDLMVELKARLASTKIEIITEASPGMDLRARTKNFSIVTRIKDWTDGIHGADQ
jgi:DNA primase